MDHVTSLAPSAATTHSPRSSPVVLNDVHSRLSASAVAECVRPTSVADVRAIVARAELAGAKVIAAGGRHAMGGQQFAGGGIVVDTRGMNRVLALDRRRGLVTVEAGIDWPGLIDALERLQGDERQPWTIRQKQTGADRLTLGGALSANAHGRGLTMRPIIDDVESFELIDAAGVLRVCSRHENPDLFRLAIGGYGLFGIIATVTLRLERRTTLRRDVELIDADRLVDAFDARIAAGYRFGDFQFAIDPASHDFLRRGVFACYRPVEHEGPLPKARRELSPADFAKLLELAHFDKSRGFERYASHYLATSGQLYESDRHQLAIYPEGYHDAIDRRRGCEGTEMITELYVPRPALSAFLAATRDDFRRHATELIYGTIRLIERDDESFLAWAREPWACVVFNLHLDHDPAGIARGAAAFRRLIDRAIELGGSFYLTYHRFATREQVDACHPRFAEFLRRKRDLDPLDRFDSDWYRHYRAR